MLGIKDALQLILSVLVGIQVVVVMRVHAQGSSVFLVTNLVYWLGGRHLLGTKLLLVPGGLRHRSTYRGIRIVRRSVESGDISPEGTSARDTWREEIAAVRREGALVLPGVKRVWLFVKLVDPSICELLVSNSCFAEVSSLVADDGNWFHIWKAF